MDTETIDRIAPTHRPPLKPAGHQRWRKLLFVHWSFSPEQVRPQVPPELDLDLHDGRAWVGLVPFVMEDIRPAWVPGGLGFNFLETNLRTYVTYEGRPGVYFFSLEASSWIAVQVARSQWSLPYFHARMRMEERDGAVLYRTERKDASRAALEAHYKVGDEMGASQPGTFEHFLLERYLLFAKRKGVLLEGQVHHTPYPARSAEVLNFSEGLIAQAGLPGPGIAPEVAHYSEGVEVEVFGPWPAKSRPY